jgi:hypothetical protein
VDLRRLWWPASAGGFSSEDCALDRWKDLYVISLFQGVCWLKVEGVSVISLFHLFNGVSRHKKKEVVVAGCNTGSYVCTGHGPSRGLSWRLL